MFLISKLMLSEQCFCSYGPLYANDESIKECIECPELHLECIRKLYGITYNNLADAGYRVIYVLQGAIRVVLSHSKEEKLIDVNGLILIPKEIKFSIEGINEQSASCIVKSLAVVKNKSSKRDIPKCPYKKNCCYK
ncbi:hypothetical protein SOV_15840 [Sporomusa ovata DSM 2662]|uniref:hypothetical protein n=1 Tax=Sporomusa ovata TaxID=2378 RepID=UPI000388476D|nr:hypothetical protein [Sporomusa ovata]EQB29188.1 hypothetical protein SOV_1c09200 [Sporomusa ovata DSM 2662]